MATNVVLDCIPAYQRNTLLTAFIRRFLAILSFYGNMGIPAAGKVTGKPFNSVFLTGDASLNEPVAAPNPHALLVEIECPSR